MGKEKISKREIEKNAEDFWKNKGYAFGTIEEEVKQAYLAGFKAGRPQWHKVADGDLPKNHKLSVIGLLKDGKPVIAHRLVECYYSKECGWSDCYGDSLYHEVEYWTESNFPAEEVLEEEEEADNERI